MASFMHYNIIKQRHMKRKSQISSGIIPIIRNIISDLFSKIFVRSSIVPFNKPLHVQDPPARTVFHISAEAYAPVLNSRTRRLVG